MKQDLEFFMASALELMLFMAENKVEERKYREKQEEDK